MQRFYALQSYEFTIMAHFNIIDRIYFAGERSRDKGDRKVSGPGAITGGLIFPLIVLLNKLHELHLLPSGKLLSILYGAVPVCALFFGIWRYYVKTGRHERVMNYYRGRATDTTAYNYAYIIGWNSVSRCYNDNSRMQYLSSFTTGFIAHFQSLRMYF